MNPSLSGHTLQIASSDPWISCCYFLCPVLLPTPFQVYLSLSILSDFLYLIFPFLSLSLSSAFISSLKWKLMRLMGLGKMCHIQSLWDTWWYLIVFTLTWPSRALTRWTVHFRAAHGQWREKWKRRSL